MSDRLGRFLDAYDEYLRGERDYRDIPILGDVEYAQVWSCPRCDRRWTEGTTTSRTPATFVKLCADCEVWAREPQKPLPVCRLVKRGR